MDTTTNKGHSNMDTAPKTAQEMADRNYHNELELLYTRKAELRLAQTQVELSEMMVNMYRKIANREQDIS